MDDVFDLETLLGALGEDPTHDSLRRLVADRLGREGRHGEALIIREGRSFVVEGGRVTLLDDSADPPDSVVGTG